MSLPCASRVTLADVICAEVTSVQEATRQLRLRCMPPYLCLSLQRFVFDYKVGWFVHLGLSYMSSQLKLCYQTETCWTQRCSTQTLCDTGRADAKRL